MTFNDLKRVIVTFWPHKMAKQNIDSDSTWNLGLTSSFKILKFNQKNFKTLRILLIEVYTKNIVDSQYNNFRPVERPWIIFANYMELGEAHGIHFSERIFVNSQKVSGIQISLSKRHKLRRIRFILSIRNSLKVQNIHHQIPHHRTNEV